MNEHWSIRYVRHVIAETGLSASALAAKAGIVSTTLTRPLNKAGHEFDISRRTLDKIQAATGISYAAFASQGLDQAREVSVHDLYESLPADKQREAIDYLLFLKARAEKP